MPSYRTAGVYKDAVCYCIVWVPVVILSLGHKVENTEIFILLRHSKVQNNKHPNTQVFVELPRKVSGLFPAVCVGYFSLHWHCKLTHSLSVCVSSWWFWNVEQLWLKVTGLVIMINLVSHLVAFNKLVNKLAIIKIIINVLNHCMPLIFTPQ